MRCTARFPALMLLLSLILVAGCGGGNSAKRAPTVAPGTPTGLLVFSTVDKGPSQADYRIEDYETTLYDLDSRTGAIRWKSPTYTGQAVQQSVAIGTHAFFAIAANGLDESTSSPSGSVSIYVVDLATGASTLLTTLTQVYSFLGTSDDLDLSIAQLNATTALLRYSAYQDASRVAETLLAFTSTPTSPLWRVTLSNAALPGMTPDTAIVDGTVAVMAQDTATLAPILFEINGTNGHILRKVVLPHIGCTEGGCIHGRDANPGANIIAKVLQRMGDRGIFAQGRDTDLETGYQRFNRRSLWCRRWSSALCACHLPGKHYYCCLYHRGARERRQPGVDDSSPGWI